MLDYVYEIGAHILSGAVMDARALSDLIPDWMDKGAALYAAVSEDRFLFLTESSSFNTPYWMVPELVALTANCPLVSSAPVQPSPATPPWRRSCWRWPLPRSA